MLDRSGHKNTPRITTEKTMFALRLERALKCCSALEAAGLKEEDWLLPSTDAEVAKRIVEAWKPSAS